MNRIGNKDRLYRMRIYPIDEEYGEIEWVAEFPDLPGCMGAGDTAEEAMAMAMDAKKAWIESALEDDDIIPEPSDIYKMDYSGKFTLRIPKSLHREMAIKAEDEEISLNQLALYLIAKGINGEVSVAENTAEGTKTDFRKETVVALIGSIYNSWEESMYSDDVSLSTFKDIIDPMLNKRRF